MAAKLELIDNYQSWLNRRGTGVGASEGSCILGMNPFKPCISLYYDKIGFNPKPFINMSMLEGEEMENFVSRQFECWDGSNETHAHNMKAGNKIRSCEKYPKYAYVVNDSEGMEHMMVSPDRKFQWDAKGISGVLEIKNRSNSMIKDWKDNIYVPDMIQTRIQMFVGEEDHGILAYRLTDYPKGYKEHYLERDGVIWHNEFTGETVTENDYRNKVNDFWGAVLIAREASEKMRQAKLDFALDKAEMYAAIISEAEPEVDSTIAFENYVKENFFSFQKTIIQITGTEEHEKIAEEYLKAKEESKVADSKLQLAKNKILNICKSGTEVKLPGKGIISVNNTKSGIKIKVKN